MSNKDLSLSMFERVDQGVVSQFFRSFLMAEEDLSEARKVLKDIKKRARAFYWDTERDRKSTRLNSSH